MISSHSDIYGEANHDQCSWCNTSQITYRASRLKNHIICEFRSLCRHGRSAAMAPKTLSDVSGNKFVSSSTLSAVLTNVKHNPDLLKQGLTRWSLKRKRVAAAWLALHNCSVHCFVEEIINNYSSA